jgi:anaerobic selenocysteine-containing dehydrogenase
MLESNESDNAPLLLIGRRHVRSNNSWLHNSHRLVKGKNRCTLIIHPEDAKKAGIKSGELTSVSSRVGQVEIEAEISEDIMQGVVSIPHGWGHQRKGIKLSIASKRPGVSLNDLTDDRLVDKLSGASILNGTPVQVVKAGQKQTKRASRTQKSRVRVSAKLSKERS